MLDVSVYVYNDELYSKNKFLKNVGLTFKVHVYSKIALLF